jgi:hypothetical protein
LTAHGRCPEERAAPAWRQDHPLIVIADQKWRSAKPPVRMLNLENLTEWLAGRTGLDYLHIDP